MSASARAAGPRPPDAQTDVPAALPSDATTGVSEARGGSPVPAPVSGLPSSEALELAVDRLGPFGLYQRYSLALLCVPSLLAAMHGLSYVFVADQVPFRCAVPECEVSAAGGGFFNETVSALLPAGACQRYAPLRPGNHSCDPQDFLQDTIDCDHFVYLNQETIYAEFNLACREWLRTAVGSVRGIALPIALVLTGFLSDRYGRVSALCVFSLCSGVLGVVKGFSINYYMFLAMEFLEAMLGYGFNSAAYVMMVELARPAQRAAFACATGVAYGVGGMLLSWLAWRAASWRRVLWAAHGPALLLPLYWLLLDESWRWLHVRGRGEQAAKIIRKAARWNKVTLDEEVMKRLAEGGDDKTASSTAGQWRRLLRSRVLLGRFAVCSWCWVAVAFVYYGLTINSVALSGDKYVNFALNMAMEVVASLLLVMALERFGRKWSIFAAFLLCGLACCSPFFISHSGAVLGLYFTGKLSITFAFNSMYVFTAELFPTAVRSSALSACSLVGRLGSVLAPQTPLLSGELQAVLYGACSVLAALAVLLAPETRHARLPHDVAAAEHIRAPRPSLPPPAPPRPPRVFSADT